LEFHVGQFGYIRPVLDALIEEGVNVEILLQKSGLNRFKLDDNNLYVPVNAMYRFFDVLDEQEGHVDILGNFFDRIQLASFSEAGEAVASTADLLAACRLGEKYNDAFLSHEQAGFEVNGQKAMFWHRFIDKQEHIGGRERLTLVSFSIVLSGLHLAAGKDWAPLEIHLQSKSAPDLDAILPAGANTKIYLNQPVTAIVFPTAMLTLPMSGSGLCEDASQAFFADTATLSSRIEYILDAFNQETLPNIKTFAEITDMSTRTLQRRLSEQDSSYFEVIDQWRFKTALKLLDNPGIRIKDISEKLYYANVPNFERAFRRWTQTSPNRYRELI
jgi:AraC-like DNA-binding protein